MDDENKEIEEKINNDIEIIEGNGKDLDISPVYDHIKMDDTEKNNDKNQEIIIPKNQEEKK